MLKYFCRNIILAFLLALLALSYQAMGQKSRSQLDQERQENLQLLEQANRILEQTQTERESSLGQLSALERQEKIRRRIISSLSRQIAMIQQDMSETGMIATALETDLGRYKKEYAAMIYAAGKVGPLDRIIFLFASQSFNQLSSRIKYLRQYAKARRQQLELIERVRKTLADQQVSLSSRRMQKEKLLLAQLTEREKLQLLKIKKNELISQLSQKEGELRSELADRQQAERQLEKLILDMVSREIRKASRRARAARPKRNSTNNTTTSTDSEPEAQENKIILTPEAAILSNSFADNKSRLSWPVSSGFISDQFGRHRHAVMKNIIINNLGVNIQTNKDEKVRSVFDGEIKRVGNTQGNGEIVIIQHGEYFTVYSNLKTVSVEPGQQVRAKEVIGQVYTDKKGVSEIKFQIWKNKNELNPELWLFKE